MAAKLAERGPNATFFAGDRLTIADFIIFSHYMSMSHNDGNTKPIKDRAAAKVAETSVVEEYITRMKAEMADYLVIRISAPF